jgi:hypothetical protein
MRALRVSVLYYIIAKRKYFSFNYICKELQISMIKNKYYCINSEIYFLKPGAGA